MGGEHSARIRTHQIFVSVLSKVLDLLCLSVAVLDVTEFVGWLVLMVTAVICDSV